MTPEPPPLDGPPAARGARQAVLATCGLLLLAAAVTMGAIAVSAGTTAGRHGDADPTQLAVLGVLALMAAIALAVAGGRLAWRGLRRTTP